MTINIWDPKYLGYDLACLNQFEYDFDNTFEAQLKIIENSENYLNQLNIELRERILNDPYALKRPKNIDEEMDHSQYMQHHFGHDQNFLSGLIQIQRRSAIISLYSLFEGTLQELIKLINDEPDFKSMDISKKPSIHDYWKHLKEDIAIKKESISPFYIEISKQQCIRHAITHNGSNINATDIGFIKSFTGLELLSYGDTNNIVLANSEYAIHLFTLMSNFFKQLFIELDNRYKEIKIQEKKK